MNFHQSFLLALKSLSTGKVRAFLTMLGIIIGVGAVIIIVSLGQGLQNEMNSAISGLGTDLLTVNVMGRGSSRQVGENDFYEFAEENKDIVRGVSPTATVSATMKFETEELASTLRGVNEQYCDIKNLTVTQGRGIQYVDCYSRMNVCVVGSYLAREVLAGDPIGKQININGFHYEVVGVLEEQADSSEGSSDDMILVPYTCATKLSGGRMMTSYTVAAASADVADQVETALERMLYRVFQSEDAYTILNMASMMTEVNNLVDSMVLFLVAIAAISLLVGGIGIMNIMLVSVTERTREIGIRKSVGAKERDILSQFIIEAGTTSGVGGVIGILFGVVCSGLIGKLVGFTAVATVGAILLAFGVSVGIGILFGFLPARKAAKLNPIDALRYD